MRLYARVMLATSVLLCAGFSLASEQLSPERLFPVFDGNWWGYINESGKLTITGLYSEASPFSEGFACVGTSRGETFINSKGMTLLSPQFSACGTFSEGRAAVAVDTEKTNRACSDCDLFLHWGYIDDSGEIVIRPQYHAGRNFSEGLAAVENDAGKWGFIDKDGRIVIGFRYDYCASFADGLATIVSNNRYGYIDHTGQAAIRPRFKQALSFSEGLAAVRINGGFSPPLGCTIRFRETLMTATNVHVGSISTNLAIKRFDCVRNSRGASLKALPRLAS